MSQIQSGNKYLITSALMGFGHLRAAHNISSYSQAPIVRVDREPNVNAVDKFVWSGSQYLHTYASRGAEGRNRLLYKWFEGVMSIPEDHQSPSMAESNFIHLLKRCGVGKTFFHELNGSSTPLLHTFYLPAMLSLYWNYSGRNFLLLCDTDFHRVWVPTDPTVGNLEYFVPISGSADRLISYGVPSGRIHVTGFPLPPASTGGRDLGTLISNFDVRRMRLKPNSTVPLTIMFPFSGAGTYSNVLADLVKTILDDLREGSLRLTVSCGNNEHALRNAENILANYRLDESEFTEIIFDKDIFASFDKFNNALKSADLIITKPSEMVFYAGLGIPMVFLPPIGAHEAKNRRYLVENKCAADMGNVSDFPRWLDEARRSGKLLEFAEMGYRNITKTGTYEIDDIMRSV
jgi:Domain of unknown function (DUF6938)